MSERRKFRNQRAAGRRPFDANFRRATESLPVATFEEKASTELEDKMRRLADHLARNPNDKAFSQVLGHLGQATTRLLIASGRCSDLMAQAAVDATSALAERRRGGDIDGAVFLEEFIGTIALATSLDGQAGLKALEVATFATRVVRGQDLPGMAKDIAAAARIPVVNLPHTHGLTLVENRLMMGNPQTCGADVHQLIRQLTAGVK